MGDSPTPSVAYQASRRHPKPSVAIFFACNDDGGKDGRLHVFAVPKSIIKPFNSDEVAVISNFAKLPRVEQNLLLGKTESDAIDDVYPAEARGISEGIRLFALAKAHHHSAVRRERPDIQDNIDVRDLFRVFVVEPQQTFERIRAQSGAFLLSAFHDRFERTEILKANPETPVYGHHVLGIPYARKTDLLDDLSMLNVRLETPVSRDRPNCENDHAELSGSFSLTGLRSCAQWTFGGCNEVQLMHAEDLRLAATKSGGMLHAGS